MHGVAYGQFDGHMSSQGQPGPSEACVDFGSMPGHLPGIGDAGRMCRLGWGYLQYIEDTNEEAGSMK